MYSYSSLTRQSPKHSSNEDSIRIHKSNQGYLIVVLCDGVSGCEGGEVASEGVTYRLVKEFKNLQIPDDYDLEFLKRWFEKSIELAKEDLEIEAKINNHLYEMATTACVGIFIKQNMYVFNIGDSRAYVLNHLGIKLLTKDQNLGNYMRDKNLPMDDTTGRYSKDSLVNFIGINNNFKRLSFDSFHYELHDQDVAMFCTDGIYRFIDFYYDELKDKSMQQACIYLMNKAIAANTNDDATLALVKYGKSQE